MTETITTPDAAVLRERLAALRGEAPDRTVLGIVGAPGSGKSTLAAELSAGRTDAEVAQVPMDGYHLADAALDRLGLRDRKGAPETFDPGGYTALLRRLRTDTDVPVFAPAFERDLEQPIANSIIVWPSVELVVTEGNYLLLDGPWAGVRELLDEVWYVEVDEDVRMSRLVDRHVRFGKDPAFAKEWIESVDEPNARLVETSRERADLVIKR